MATMTCSLCMLFVLLVASAMKHVAADDSEVAFDAVTVDTVAPDSNVAVNEERVEYARGSVCGYCTYCKTGTPLPLKQMLSILERIIDPISISQGSQFCKLCDKDCPCERTDSKPNCHMCKYCKYCNLCSAICDTICTPGGIIDRVSGAIVNSLPSFDKEEVDDDIASVQHWIETKKDEL